MKTSVGITTLPLGSCNLLMRNQMKYPLLVLIICALFGSAYADDSKTPKTHELKLVKQITNINAPSAGMIHQFIPDYIEINVGDSVKFLGTVGRHTVHSVKGMYPEGFKKISIMPRQPNTVLFDKPGIYGIKCKIHQRHGMVALVVVGGDIHNMKKARASVKGGVSSFTVPKLHKLLDKAEASFGTKKGKNNSAKETLGQLLFFDKNLSQNRTQSCATCHAPEHGFIDNRDNGVGGMVSLGDDGKSLGDRNAPTAAYAMFSPDFSVNKKGIYKGGQFHDGREKDLAGQAGGPPTNPIEMGMKDKASTVERLKENKNYLNSFKGIYGDDIFNDTEKAYSAMADSIASFERTDLFAPFDSKYDRYLKGEYKLTKREDLGMTLFFSKQFTNCNICHQLNKSQTHKKETFTNYEYHNIGVPANTALREKNGKGKDFIDHGLLENPAVLAKNDKKHDAKYKVPTLRNIAVTGPYMHNGIFKDLKTVVLFYDKYNSRSKKRTINPETEKTWAEPEVAETISFKELKAGPALKMKRINALVAFMKTLTDKRYEYLLNL